ncbi:MAG: outer membrane lipoprotein carrier protein LolA [Candidatus Electrothrix sp. AR3]|nr:outer membrane lipoprotein carrier protein LolA [Candidatus Electrothrix sp. AR3]
MDRLLQRPAPLLILLFCLLAAAPYPAFADKSATTSIPAQQLEHLKNIQKKYQKLTSLHFSFQQTVQSNGRLRYGEGNCIFYRSVSGRPGIMRWNYTKPDVQIILNDGKDLSIYTQKDKQLLVTSAKDLQTDIIYSFFSGNRNLLDDFTILPANDRFLTQGDKKVLVVQLIPTQPHGQVRAIHLWFDEQSILRKLLMEDHFDTVTELIFTQVKFDTLAPESVEIATQLVLLELPPDTEVIKQ